MPLALELSAPALFVAGATTSLHCALMCGAINAAQARSHGPVPLHQALALVHGGRVLGYALLGILAGALGGRLAFWLPDTMGGGAIQLLASLALIAAGVQQFLGRRRRVAAGCCERPAPLSQRLPAPARLLAQGLLWALMPCGILYTVLLLAALTTSAASGALLLAAFGLGTLPVMGLSGGMLGRAAQPQRARRLRLGAAALLVAFGLAGVIAAALHGDPLVNLLCSPFSS